MYDALFHPRSRIVLGVVLALSVLLPTGDLGFVLCWFRNVTGLPCPGCGLTRSFVSFAHFRFREAFHYHPFGPLLYVCAVAITAIWFMRSDAREAIARFCRTHDRLVHRVYWTFLLSFVGFGIARLALTAVAPQLLPVV